jgi:hypothetical protein
MNGSGKWTHEALEIEEEMDAIKSGNTPLRKASRLWSIPLSSLSITI